MFLEPPLVSLGSNRKHVCYCVCVFVWSLALRMGAASVGGVVASQRALGHACRVGVGFDICSQLLPCVFLRVSSSWGEKECNEQRFRC